MESVRWGIIGCGGIAHTFAKSLLSLDSGKLLAGASRSQGRAAEFVEKYGMERAYQDYESLVKDPDVDAVYVATTHNFHYDNIKLCLQHGKHVLCEKPFTVNAAQTEELIALAREKDVFLMEAVWTRFLPAIQALSKLLDEGVIGEVLTVEADFCVTGNFGDDHRLKNKALAGGALLDLGIYPITFASLIFGVQPKKIQSSAVIGNTGVDERSFYLFEYENGRTAQLSASFTTASPIEAMVFGREGYIRVPHFLGAEKLHVHRQGEEPEVLDFSFEKSEQFKFEIAHAIDCIVTGKKESDILPPSETLAVMKTMDAIRAQWGLKYDGE